MRLLVGIMISCATIGMLQAMDSMGALVIVLDDIPNMYFPKEQGPSKSIKRTHYAFKSKREHLRASPYVQRKLELEFDQVTPINNEKDLPGSIGD